ncbi:MAG: dihydroorotase [Clostridia bacterium]|nr:dihydroorotase [Clostridia bacterium]
MTNGAATSAYVFRNGIFKKETVTLPVTLDASESLYLIPGFADVHVHLREPGFSYKETVKTGTLAAAAGGYTAVCPMPNLNPVPDSPENLAVQSDCIRRDACVLTKPFGAITKGEAGKALSDMEAIADDVAGFSDDGRGVADAGLMREAMIRAKALGKVIAAHCEDTRYLPEDPKSEWSEVERDILLAKETGCALHICHVSSAVSLGLIRQAKRDGIDVTSETGPHYLLLDAFMRPDSGDWKMNPPLRFPSDREALLEALSDGTVDMIATDHAPHSAEEKSRGFAKSLNGIVGRECAFPVLYSGLVKTGFMTLETLIEKMSTNPRRRFSLGGEEVTPDTYAVLDLDTPYVICADRFASMGRSTPFNGRECTGRCLLTVYGGNTVWNSKRNLTEN